jgi:hypothetical protein
MRHAPGLEAVERLGQVAAHQVNRRGGEFLAGMSRRVRRIGRMNAHLGRRQREDQPPFARIDGSNREHVAEERPVGLRIAAVEQQMHTQKHDGIVTRIGVGARSIFSLGIVAANSASIAGAPVMRSTRCCAMACPLITHCVVWTLH